MYSNGSEGTIHNRIYALRCHHVHGDLIETFCYITATTYVFLEMYEQLNAYRALQ